MAPLEALLRAAEDRGVKLEDESSKLGKELGALEEEVAAKRAEKSIAAMEAVKELLKQKEALQKKVRTLDAAAGTVRQALAKLREAKSAGLADWRELLQEKLQLSEFALKKLKDEAAFSSLRTAAGGGSVSIEGTALVFRGSSKALPKVQQAIKDLESSFAVSVEVEADLLRMLELREELKRLGTKHGVDMSPAGTEVNITGPVEGVKKAEKMLKFFLTGKAELTCPRELIGACKAKAKEIEMESGAFIDVARGGFGGGGIVRIRGDAECVSQAEEQLRSWFDEREGAYSVFVEAKDAFAALSSEKIEQLKGDLVHFGRKFGILAQVVDTRVELRGTQGGDWEAPARGELQQILQFYAPTPAPKATAGGKAKAKAKAPQPKAPEPDDDWGAAPEADFELGHQWK